MPATQLQLGYREREILDVVYALRGATVTEVRDALATPPSYSAVRAILGKLQHKGFLNIHTAGKRYIYFPREARERTLARTIGHVVRTFFGGSARRTVAAILDSRAKGLTAEELDALTQLIREKKAERLRARRGRHRRILP